MYAIFFQNKLSSEAVQIWKFFQTGEKNCKIYTVLPNTLKNQGAIFLNASRKHMKEVRLAKESFKNIIKHKSILLTELKVSHRLYFLR